MAEIALGLTAVFFCGLCVVFRYDLNLERKLHGALAQEVHLLRDAFSRLNAVKAIPLTAGDIVESKKRRMPFTTHKSWKEEQAELEARDDQERIRHEKLVTEIEKEKP